MEASNPIRVFVCGGRAFSDSEALRKVLAAVAASTGCAAIIEGGDRAGFLAAIWARERSIPVVSVPAERRAHDLAIIAQRIVEKGRPDLAISMQGGKLTARLFEELTRAGVKVYNVPALTAT